MKSSESTAKTSRPTSVLNWRILLLCFVAISPSLGTAVSAIGRLLLYITATFNFLLPNADSGRESGQKLQILTVLILIIIGYMLATVAWSSVPVAESLHAWTRHARILTIPIVYLMIKNSAEGKIVLRAFTFGQIFVVLSAWLLVWGIKVPWATATAAKETYAVFGSYLEQSISQSVLAAILWFGRDWIFGPRGRWAAIFGAFITLVLTLGFLQGRSGHVVALVIIAMAIMYELPRRQKWLAVVIVAGVVALSIASSKNFRDRMISVSSEVSAYSDQTVAESSSGLRLYYWHVSVLAAMEKPLLGHGAGSWNHEYRRLGLNKANPSTLTVSDPHQLFLLWMVEGGLVGMGLLIVLLVYILKCSRKLEQPYDHMLQATIVALVISSMFNSMIFGIGMGDFFCIAIGILLGMHGNTISDAKAGRLL